MDQKMMMAALLAVALTGAGFCAGWLLRGSTMTPKFEMVASSLAPAKHLQPVDAESRPPRKPKMTREEREARHREIMARRLHRSAERTNGMPVKEKAPVRKASTPADE